MSRSFRFLPPEPRPDLLTRPRLLRSLIGRWQHRVTAVTGGPGLGKTTLLAQAIAENRLAPRGEDVWIGVERHDADADRLARVVATAIAARPDDAQAPNPASVADAVWQRSPAETAASVADAVWQRSPAETCLFLDDVHLLPAGSSGAAWLADLVHLLPVNGHIVFASRSDPPVPLSRYDTLGAVLRLAEDDLRFSDDELLGFAAQRGLDPRRFADTGGWPAMAELTASVAHDVTGAYLWEEVLEPLGTVRRHVLAALCDLGGADDELASAAVGRAVELARELDGVPLIARGADGWHVPHGLWRTAPRIALPPTEATEIRRRAVRNLGERGRFDAAFGLVEAAELWDEAPGVLRSACLSGEIPSRQLGRWLAASPENVRDSPAGRLAAGLHTASTDPEQAVKPLRAAAAMFRDEGDPDAELVAIAQIGRMAWWWQDLSILMRLSGRVVQLHTDGYAKATALASLGWAMASDVAGDDAEVLRHIEAVEPGVLDPATELLSQWLRGAVHLYMGDADTAAAIAVELDPAADPSMQYIVDTLQMMAWWVEGRVDEVLLRTPGVIAAARASGIAYTLSLGMHTASLAYSHSGDIPAARACLEEARATAPTPQHGVPSVHTAMATASLQLAEGDEAGATATLHKAMEAHGLDKSVERRWWRQMVSLSYVLLPEARVHWDDVADLRGHLATARDLAAAVVAVRAGQSEAHVLRALHVPDLAVVRAELHHRLAAELAVGLTAAGRQEGRRLLDLLGPPGRDAVRALSTADSRQAKQAKALLAAVAAPPPHVTHLGMLGPLEVRRGGPGGDPLDDPDLRRQRVHALLAFLVGHRRTTRAAVTAALWPDLDERSANNNLGVNLNRLLRLLEPWRKSGEPAFFVRMDGPGMQLITGEHLCIDVDAFDEHLALAARAEADGIPSVALERYLTVVALYRSELHVDLPEAEWFALDREHYRTRFVRAAVRAGQLLLTRDEGDRAQAVAQRALAVDPWAEDAYAVLVGGALARGDRSAARRLLNHCLETLADLGAQPSSATEQLRRRVEQPT